LTAVLAAAASCASTAEQFLTTAAQAWATRCAEGQTLTTVYGV
jgi:hypothetical protein